MKRGDLTDDELKQCIMSLPEMKGIDERLIERFHEFVFRYGGSEGVMVFIDAEKIRQAFESAQPKNPHAYFRTTCSNFNATLQRRKSSRREVTSEVDRHKAAEMPYESTEQRCEEATEKFDLADEALASSRSKLRCGFLIAYEGIERPLDDELERAPIKTVGANDYKHRLAHADRPTVGEVSASATKLSAHNKGKWTVDKLVEAFNHAADSALCPNPVTGRKWNTRIKVACKNAQSILNKDC